MELLFSLLKQLVLMVKDQIKVVEKLKQLL
jgi:hypothetical protein